MKNGSLSYSLAVITLLVIFVQNSKAETALFPHVSIDYDAHSAAMAGAAVARVEGSAGVLSNPAATASVENMQAFIGYRTIIDDVWGAPIVFSRSFKKYGVFSALVCGLSSGDVEVIDELGGEPVYTDKIAGADYLTGGLSWAYRIEDKISVGATLKGLYNRLDDGDIVYSAKGVAVDAGILYRLLNKRFTFGAAVRNAGFVVKSYDEEKYDMPFTVEAGISYAGSQLSSMRMALDISKKIGEDLSFEPAIDVDIYKKVLALRLGYAFSDRDIKKFFKKLGGHEDENYVKSNWNALCVGVGFNKKIQQSIVAIDFALQFHTSFITPSTIVSASVDF